MKKHSGKRYKWRPGTTYADLPAGLAVEELNKIAENNGGITAEAVVAAARPKSSPLHVAFEWDDSAAGAAYRLDQARRLIKSVELVVDDVVPVPVFYNIKTAEGRVYQPAEAVVQNTDWYASALSQLKTRLDSFDSETTKSALVV